MREAILVAMHDSKNVVYVEDGINKIIAEGVAPQHHALFKDVTRIECYWWGDRNTIEMHVTGASGEETCLLYQGAYTAILVLSPYMELKAQPEQPSIERLAVRRDVFEDWEGRS